MDSKQRKYVCQKCLADPDIPSGFEKKGEIQLFGVWLCKYHFEELDDTNKFAAFRYVNLNRERY